MYFDEILEAAKAFLIKFGDAGISHRITRRGANYSDLTFEQYKQLVSEIPSIDIENLLEKLRFNYMDKMAADLEEHVNKTRQDNASQMWPIDPDDMDFADDEEIEKYCTCPDCRGKRGEEIHPVLLYVTTTTAVYQLPPANRPQTEEGEDDDEDASEIALRKAPVEYLQELIDTYESREEFEKCARIRDIIAEKQSK